MMNGRADWQLPDTIESCDILAGYLRSRDVDAGVLTAAREVWDRYLTDRH
jgi:hypothetical protein